MLAFPWIYSKVWSLIFAYWITAPASLSLSYASCHPVLHDRLLARGNLAFYENEALLLLVGWLLYSHIFSAWVLIASHPSCFCGYLLVTNCSGQPPPQWYPYHLTRMSTDDPNPQWPPSLVFFFFSRILQFFQYAFLADGGDFGHLAIMLALPRIQLFPSNPN